MEAAEVARGEQADRQKTKPQSRRVNGGAQVEVSDTADQDISDGEVDNAPRHVDGRRGKTLAGRWRKGSERDVPSTQ